MKKQRNVNVCFAKIIVLHIPIQQSGLTGSMFCPLFYSHFTKVNKQNQKINNCQKNLDVVSTGVLSM